MKSRIAVDIGNSRLKWGRCTENQVVESAALPLDDPAQWEGQLARWAARPPVHWIVAGVNPDAARRFSVWLNSLGGPVQFIDSHSQIQIEIWNARPEQIGLDRILNAVACASKAIFPAVIIDAGSAITVDRVNELGVFEGGAILPGLPLMSRSLHDYTARLPLVDARFAPLNVPGQSTDESIRAGILGGTSGGINSLYQMLTAPLTSPAHVYLTGGDAKLLRQHIDLGAELWPNMTMEGIRITGMHIHSASQG